jgi:hypothetical protein
MKVRFIVLSTVVIGCASSATSVDRSSPVVREEKTPIQEAWDEVFLSRTPEPYARVTASYEAHVASHPDDREARNRYGKLLYAQGRWRAAASEFEVVANGENDHFGRAAARNALLAWRRVLDQGDAAEEGYLRLFSEDQDVDKAALDFLWDQIVFDTLDRGEYSEKALPAVEQHIADAADRYVAIAEPTEEALPLIQLISAHSYFRHFHFAEATDRCLRIMDKWPRNDMTLTCGNVILNMYSATDDLAKLETYSRLLWQNRAAMARHTDLRASVEETLHFVAFQNAWRMVEEASRKRGNEKKKILLEAADRFRKYQDEFPQSPHADKALFNALAQYMTFGVKDNARVVAETIVEDYPQSPVAPQARQVLAQLSQ